MFREKLLVQIPYSRLRRVLAILLYVIFMVWIIYSHSKATNIQRAATKKTASY